MKFSAKVKTGEIQYYDKRELTDFLASLEDKRIDIEIKKHTEKRTLDQNSFYWLYLGVIADETGDSANDLHEYLKRKHLPPRFIKVRNTTLKIPATTTKLDKAQFSDYMERINAETGVPIPDPFKI